MKVHNKDTYQNLHEKEVIESVNIFTGKLPNDLRLLCQISSFSEWEKDPQIDSDFTIAKLKDIYYHLVNLEVVLNDDCKYTSYDDIFNSVNNDIEKKMYKFLQSDIVNKLETDNHNDIGGIAYSGIRDLHSTYNNNYNYDASGLILQKLLTNINADESILTDTFTNLHKAYTSSKNKIFKYFKINGIPYAKVTIDDVTKDQYSKELAYGYYIANIAMMYYMVTEHVFDVSNEQYKVCCTLVGENCIIKSRETNQAIILVNAVCSKMQYVIGALERLIGNHLVSNHANDYKSLSIISTRLSKQSDAKFGKFKSMVTPANAKYVDMPIESKILHLNSGQEFRCNRNIASKYRRFFLDNPFSHLVLMTYWFGTNDSAYVKAIYGDYMITKNMDIADINAIHNTVNDYLQTKGTRKLFKRLDIDVSLSSITKGGMIGIRYVNTVNLLHMAMMTNSIISTIVSPYHRGILCIANKYSVPSNKMHLFDGSIVGKFTNNINVDDNIDLHITSNKVNTNFNVLERVCKLETQFKDIFFELTTDSINKISYYQTNNIDLMIYGVKYAMKNIPTYVGQARFLQKLNKLSKSQITDAYLQLGLTSYFNQISTDVIEMELLFYKKYIGDVSLLENRLVAFHDMVTYVCNKYEHIINDIDEVIYTKGIVPPITKMLSDMIFTTKSYIGMDGDNYHQLFTSDMLSSESRLMNHCVRGYSNSIGTMKSVIYHIDLDTKGGKNSKLGSTIQYMLVIRKNRETGKITLDVLIEQHYGFGNHTVINPDSLKLAQDIKTMLIKKLNADNKIFPLNFEGYECKQTVNTNMNSKINKQCAKQLVKAIIVLNFSEMLVGMKGETQKVLNISTDDISYIKQENNIDNIIHSQINSIK